MLYDGFRNVIYILMVTDILGKEQLTEILWSTDKLVLLDFWAERCGPCRMLWPVLHDLAEKHPEKILVLKVNVDADENAELSAEYAVRSIPQVTLIRNGEKVDQFIGAIPPAQIEEMIEKYTANMWSASSDAEWEAWSAWWVSSDAEAQPQQAS